MRALALSPFAPAFALGAGLLGAGIGLIVGHAFLLPVLQAALAYPIFLGAVREGRHGRAVGLMLLWAVATSIPVILASRTDPGGTEPAILRGKEYRDEMFAWIRTGVGKESDPGRFLPEHGLHFATFALLAYFSVGAGALLLGAVLLDYMNFYVGALLAAAADPAAVAPFAWPVYAVVRVIGYVVCATALAGLRLRGPEPDERRRPLGLLALGFSLVLADALLKALLAPWWRERLAAGF
ncbi:MAG: hypothetical protein L0323_17695 [Planctomycetes bacterium]|nr:hypothetical protein [Planctomycetota bacterium]